MKGVRVKSFGSVEQLELVENPDPQPGSSEVLVEVQACGLNFADVLQRKGLYYAGPIPPFRPGFEGSGIVAAVGDEVHSLTVGTRVAMIASSDMHAEKVVIDPSLCIALPDSIPDDIAAAFPVHFLSAYHALTTVAHARSGETVLIHAAAGGLGSATLQLAKLLGLRVIGTASTEAKRELIRSFGADLALDYDSFEDVVREFTDGKGPEIIVDTIGGEIFRRSFHLLATLGRLLVMGTTGSDPRSLDTTKLLFDSKSVLGFHLRSLLAHPAMLEDSTRVLLDWIQQGRVRPHIGQIFPLADIRDAHTLLESRASTGKILLIP